MYASNFGGFGRLFKDNDENFSKSRFSVSCEKTVAFEKALHTIFRNGKSSCMQARPHSLSADLMCSEIMFLTHIFDAMGREDGHPGHPMLVVI